VIRQHGRSGDEPFFFGRDALNGMPQRRLSSMKVLSASL